MKCNECGKQIDEDEYVCNWCSCSDCFDNHYLEYLEKHSVTEEMNDFDL